MGLFSGRAPDISDVPCLSCQKAGGLQHECDEPRHCACSGPHTLNGPIEDIAAHTEWAIEWDNGELSSCGWLEGISEATANSVFDNDLGRKGLVTIPDRLPVRVLRRERIVRTSIGAWTTAAEKDDRP